MHSNFFAFLSRMRYITRWSLMRNTRPEDLCQHTLEVAYITHALCVLARTVTGQPVDEHQALLLALYHDCSEILTGDLPTPVKYHDPQLTASYKQLEAAAGQRLLGMLPDALQPDYAPSLTGAGIDPRVEQLVKAADKLSALIKCLQEEQAGNPEFTRAKAATLASLEALGCPEAQIFLRDFIPGYSLTLDELE